MSKKIGKNKEQEIKPETDLRKSDDKNKTNFSKRDAVLHEIHRHRENQTASINFRKNMWKNHSKFQ